MNLALRNPDQYAAAFSISGALSLEELLKIDHVSSFTSRMVKAIYGEHREYYDAHQHD